MVVWISIMNAWLQLGGYLFLTIMAFYVPLQAYARRIEPKLDESSFGTRFLSILLAYLIWYPPLAFLLIGIWSIEHFANDFNLLIWTLSWVWSGLSFLYVESRKPAR